MKIAVLGTGMVGQALASRFAELGHEVTMGARQAGNDKAVQWAAGQGGRADDFAGAAAWAELVILATLGAASLDAARAAGAGALAGKVVLDVTNPLDMSAGFPPTMLPERINTTSAAEALQAAFPDARVVKALNTMSCEIMVAPDLVPGPHDVFLCGNDAGAKSQVVALLGEMGWSAPIDLGDIAAARGTEMLMPMWLRLYQHFGDARFNWHIAR